MAQLNKKYVNPKLTTNRAGGQAYKSEDKEALVGILLTSFFSGKNDSLYETDAARKTRLTELLNKVDPTFAAKAAIFARDTFGMRTVSHIAASELAKQSFEKKESFFDKIVVRPDDMLEITANVLNKGNGGDGKLPAALKRGFASALARFNEYQLAKYRGEGKAVNIYDLINLVHPKQTTAIANIVKGTFQTPETFETKLSATGQNQEGTEEEKATAVAANKAEAWKELVSDGKIGQFALLRNLRNIFTQADADTQKEALKLLCDEKRIKSSRIMPFRYLTAYYELRDLNSSVLTALSDAFDIALKSVLKPFPGTTLVVWDDSASMGSHNGRSSVANVTLAASFAFALAKNSPDSTHVARFSHDATYVMFNHKVPTIELASKVVCPNGATDMHKIFEMAQKQNQKYDRIFIISDMQSWVTYNTAATAALQQYKAATGANPILYSWDIAGHGDSQFNPDKDNVVFLTGWMGDRVFDLIESIESGAVKGFIDKIEKVVL